MKENKPKQPRTFQALDIINERDWKGELKQNAPITLFIQQGTDIIKSDGCMRIDDFDCKQQAEWSLGRQKFHHKTKEAIRLFMDESPYPFSIEHWFDRNSTKTPLDYKILGLCELVLWSMEVAKAKNKQIYFYMYQLENGLHPCYQTRLAELFIFFHKYSLELFKNKP
tara:strand:+ start:841 stop:1344 length:504 start_codon:yes stop_codon:yes gene_type:complete